MRVSPSSSPIERSVPSALPDVLSDRKAPENRLRKVETNATIYRAAAVRSSSLTIRIVFFSNFLTAFQILKVNFAFHNVRLKFAF